MQPLGGQVANAGMEVVPEQGRGGEDEIGEAAGVGAGCPPLCREDDIAA